MAKQASPGAHPRTSKPVTWLCVVAWCTLFWGATFQPHLTPTCPLMVHMKKLVADGMLLDAVHHVIVRPTQMQFKANNFLK